MLHVHTGINICMIYLNRYLVPTSRGTLQHTSDKVIQWLTSTVPVVCWKIHMSNTYVCASTLIYGFMTDSVLLLPAAC